MGNIVQVRVWIGLGANLGEPLATFRGVIKELSDLPMSQNILCSSVYQTAPQDAPGPDYYNAVLGIDTALTPIELLRHTQEIENRWGRVRDHVHNSPRTLDIDILLYGDRVIVEKDICIPHPRLHQRAFVLVPLLELEPSLCLPGLGLAKDFLQNVQDQPISRLSVPKFNEA